MRRPILTLTLLLVVSGLAGPVGASDSGLRAESGTAALRSDFNGDGYDDLAVGADDEGIGDRDIAGAVNVIYGSAAGLTATGDQFWHQDSPGIRERAEFGDRVGNELASGDFDGDGFADLAMAAPYERLFVHEDAGAVNVLYGSASGLTAAGNQLWTQESPGMPGDARRSDRFGWALTGGDFDADGYTDLAISTPFESVEGAGWGAGSTTVLYGSSEGLSTSRVQLWTQNSPDVEDVAERGDNFGFALSAADFSGDGFVDLAIGAASETIGSASQTGSVNVIYGSPAGLTAAGDQFWSQDTPDVLDEAEAFDYFGQALAGGDFGGDGFADLAVGVEEGLSGDGSDEGGVHVLYGSTTGLTVGGNQFWTQDSPEISGAAEPGDNFGDALAAGDFSGDGFDDLAVGVEDEGFGDVGGAGAVIVIYGSAVGLTATGNQFWSQDNPRVLGEAEWEDGFGSALGAGDFNGSGFVALAVGVDRDNVGDIESAGGVNLLYGSPTGLTGEGNQLWHQDVPGIEDLAEFGDEFGYSLPG